MTDEERIDEDLAEVVRLHPERDLTDEDAPVSKKPNPPWCRHLRVVLDKEAHLVQCRECEREVDPFAFLLDLAGRWEQWATHRKEAERRARAADERLQELLRLETNARNRLKRLDPEAAKQAPKRPWGHGSR